MALPRVSRITLHVSLELTCPPRPIPGFEDLFSFGPSELNSSVRQPAASLSLSSSPSPRASLYLAVRVRSLVNVFRKRVKRRSRTAVRKKAVDACWDIEREAYQEIDRYLGRPKRNRRLKSEAGANEVAATRLRIGAASACERSVIERTLEHIENAASLNARTLTTLATNEKRFLLRKTDFDVKRLSIKQLQQLIVDVTDLLDTLTLPPASTNPPPNASQYAFDLVYTSNLQHLLLCLQSQLLRQLVHLCIELLHNHIAECQRTRRRSREDWFFEFPDARHPLSTTWPWSIRPSLAILWGVCWMFIDPINWDKEGNLIDLQGNIQVSRQEINQLLSDPVFMRNNAQQHTPQRGVSSPYNNTTQMSGAGGVFYQPYQHPGAYSHPHYSAPAQQPRLQRNGSHFPPDNATMMASQPHHARSNSRPHDTQPSSRVDNPYGESRHSPFCLSNRDADPEAAAQNQASGSFFGLAPAFTNTAYTAPPAAAHSVPVAERFLAASGHEFSTQQQEYYLQWPEQNHTLQGSRQPAHTRGDTLALQTHNLPPRPRSTSQLTPIITVTPEQPYTPDSHAQPQDSHHTSATSLHAPYRYETPAYIDHDTYLSARRIGMADVHVQQPPAQVGQMVPNHDNPLASPISDNTALSRPISPSHEPINDQHIRKRSFDEMSQQPPPPQQMQMMPTSHPSPQTIPYETSPGGLDDGHKVQRMVKRGDPPQAHDGKYYCNFAPECADQYFDRKCEWSKHMDKHDRPYRCPQAQCAKLQGFTYSGGLLRHEREVHGKHGGPKEQLRCTVHDCKRHAGKGFTRKENLNEHLRRVHGITNSTDTSASQLRQIAVDAAPGAELMETPASRFSDTGEVDEFSTTTTAYPDLADSKRRRIDMGASPRSSHDDLELELQRLKADNLMKDERIRRMEENDAAREARMKSLEDKLAQLTPQTLQQRIPEQANMGNYPDFNGSAAEVMQQVHGPAP